MKRKRRHLTPEFKARVALEALKGIRTINDIAEENDLAASNPERLNAMSALLDEWESEVSSTAIPFEPAKAPKELK